jgi:hypothetical protein
MCDDDAFILDLPERSDLLSWDPVMDELASKLKEQRKTAPPMHPMTNILGSEGLKAEQEIPTSDGTSRISFVFLLEEDFSLGYDPANPLGRSWMKTEKT